MVRRESDVFLTKFIHLKKYWLKYKVGEPPVIASISVVLGHLASPLDLQAPTLEHGIHSCRSVEGFTDLRSVLHLDHVVSHEENGGATIVVG